MASKSNAAVRSTMAMFSLVLGWMTPRRQLNHLLDTKDYKGWESFRDGLIDRWTNLNIVGGLIMGAISTILFADFPLTRLAFAFGIVSLLSSLISIGFGVGLIYVLGDVKGPTLNAIGIRYPNLYLFALSIPQVWGGISFLAFFVNTSLIGWEATNKGWLVKAGIVATLVVLLIHLVGFAFLFRSQDNPEYLIPEPEPSSGSGYMSSPRPQSESETRQNSMQPIGSPSNESQSLMTDGFELVSRTKRTGKVGSPGSGNTLVGLG